LTQKISKAWKRRCSFAKSGSIFLHGLVPHVPSASSASLSVQHAYTITSSNAK